MAPWTLECGGGPLYQKVGQAVLAWTRENLGQCGYGAVVGATHPDELSLLRKTLPDVIFLVPGYGAQGGSAKDVAAAFRPDGLGAIINSSRGITACFDPSEKNWEACVETATRKAIGELSQ